MHFERYWISGDEEYILLATNVHKVSPDDDLEEANGRIGDTLILPAIISIISLRRRLRLSSRIIPRH